MEGDVEAVGWVGRAELIWAVVRCFYCVIMDFGACREQVAMHTLVLEIYD